MSQVVLTVPRQGLLFRSAQDRKNKSCEEAVAWAAWIASRPASALAAAKRSVILGLDQAAFRDAVAVEAKIFAELYATDVEDRLRLTRAGLARYEAGADSFEAWELDPDDVQD
jgi:enoyl-CoA hydratase/carnithine racemase